MLQPSPNDSSRQDDQVQRPITVDVVYHFLPSYREAVFSELLALDDLDVRFIAGGRGPGLEEIPLADIPHDVVSNHWRGDVLWQRGLLRRLRRRDADVVIFLSSWTYLTTWLAAIGRRRSGASVLFWTHGWGRHETGMRKRVRLAFYRLSHAMLLYGTRAKQIGIDLGVEPERMFVIGNSVISDPPDLSSLNDRPTNGRVLWVARLSERKRLDLLVAAFDIAVSQGHDLRLTVVGEGPVTPPPCSAEAAERTTYLGAIHDDSELFELFTQADVVAAPAAAGLTVLHSCLHGTPVVTNDEPDENGPEYEYLDDGVNGSTFRSGQADDLASELIRWAIESPVTLEDRLKIAASAAHRGSPALGATRIRDAILDVRSRR